MRFFTKQLQIFKNSTFNSTRYSTFIQKKKKKKKKEKKEVGQNSENNLNQNSEEKK